MGFPKVTEDSVIQLKQPKLWSLVHLEKELAAHSSILDCKIPSTDEPGGLQSMGWATVHGVGYSLWECKESDVTKAT